MSASGGHLICRVSSADLDIIGQQLGRPPRAVVQIVCRCRCGSPAVVRTWPRLPDGTPFPTAYYLTLPSAVKAVSSLESEGLMAEMNRQLEADQSLRQAYAAAHRDYLERRDQLERVAQIAAVSAGGMPNRVKCLHALVAHALAVGQGINPIGDWALMAAEPRWRLDRCVC